MSSSLLGDPALLAFPAGDVFIETGMREGHTLNAAAQRGTYQALYSIELDPDMAARGRAFFHADERIQIVTGDSRLVLQHLCDPNKRTVFWLDAHVPGCPVLDELCAIRELPWKHWPTILIDDVPLFERDRYGVAQLLNLYPGQLSDAFLRDDLPMWPTGDEIREVLGPAYYVSVASRKARRVPWYQAVPA